GSGGGGLIAGRPGARGNRCASAAGTSRRRDAATAAARADEVALPAGPAIRRAAAASGGARLLAVRRGAGVRAALAGARRLSRIDAGALRVQRREHARRTRSTADGLSR